MNFCTDQDLLAWEPNLPREASFASQTMLRVSGTLNATDLTIASGSLVDAGVSVGQVVAIDGPLVGCFPVAQIVSATTCRLTILHEKYLDIPNQAMPIGAYAGLTCVFVTFAAQRRAVSELLARLAGIDPSNPKHRVVNAATLKRPAVLGVLQMIYNALAAAGGETASDLLVRAELYEKLYRRALRGVKVELDLNGDGAADTSRLLRTIELIRE